jgi:CIC family chloride channel protein
MRRRLETAIRTLELRHLGRTLLHCILVGIAVGLVACVFYLGLQWGEHLLLEKLAGYRPLRPAGEHVVELPWWKGRPFTPWVLVLVPAFGGLASGLLARWLAPEASGGGGNAFIEAFHRRGGIIRKRVIPAKLLTTIATLASGGSGGREGPTMHLGAAVGSFVGRLLRVPARERRILLVAGTAGGLAAVFGTPLGAALLATEVLYRDDFESDALIPSVLASVTAYSIFATFFPGVRHLFAHAASYPFEPRRLPLFAAFALVLALAAHLFVATLKRGHALFAGLRVPVWVRPAIGGLALGVVATTWIVWVNPHIGLQGSGVGILGSGYGAAQGAITGEAWVPKGWRGVELLAVLAILKMGSTSLTIGSGGSAGDFGPSLAIGGLLGGAFGRAAQQLVDPTIDPGAFALVGMGAFYGGLAHVPVSSLVMVCELAGNYDLLVPLMLTEGVAFVAMRRTGLYDAQVTSRFDSPSHASELTLDVLKALRVADMVPRRAVATVRPSARADEILAIVSGSEWQDTVPVLDEAGRMIGMVPADAVRVLAGAPDLQRLTVAADVMSPPVTLSAEDDLHVALERLLETGLREIPVVDARGQMIGLLDESDVARAYHDEIVRVREEPEGEG